jgi:hypothetical protein
MSKRAPKQPPGNGRHCAYLGKNYLLLYILILALIASIAITYHPDLGHPVRMSVEKQDRPARSIDQQWNSGVTAEFQVDSIDFPENTELKIDGMPSGLSENFFVDFSTVIDVKEAGYYLFSVSSDDGFALSIDGERLMNYSGTRPFGTATSQQVYLAAGKHPLTLSYFQATGPLGIQASYAKNGKEWLIGEGSAYATFASP